MKCPKCNFEIKNSSMAKFLGSIGGKKYSETLTKEQRVERSKKAISIRWKNGRIGSDGQKK